jgi:hypothetical protein
MNRLLSMLLALLLAPAIAQQVATESTILFDKRQKTVPTTAGPVRWNMGSDRVSLPFRSSKPLGIKSIDLKLGSQSMIDLRAIYSDGTKLMLGIARVKTDACLDEYGGLNDKCFIDLGLYDFNRDGIPEVVLSVGDGMMEQKVYIAQYHPPSMKEDRSRGENWTSLALDGQSACFISGDTISFRVGSRGFTDTYFFKDGKFFFKGFN